MLLILEIWLTVKAWKNGWKAFALTPGALAFFIGFMIGASSPRGNGDGSVFVIGMILDLVTIAVLGVMSANAPRRITTTSPMASGKSTEPSSQSIARAKSDGVLA